MNSKKFFLLTFSMLVIFSFIVFFASYAAEYPDKPITIIIPYNPGGGTDLTARILAIEAEKYIDQPIVPRNRPGATGTVGTYEAARAKPDGYTLLFAPTDPICMRPHILDLEYSLNDFRGVVGVVYNGGALAVRTDSSWETLEDLITDKDSDVVINRGHSGIGGLWQLILDKLFREAGIENFRDIPFDGGAATLSALLGGHVDVIMGSPGAMIPSIESGQIRLLAMTSPKRLDLFPNVPTLKEKGFDIEGTVEFFLLAPKDTPDDRIDLLEEIFSKAANSEKFKEFVKNRKQQLYIRNGEELMKKLQRDFAACGEMVK